MTTLNKKLKLKKVEVGDKSIGSNTLVSKSQEEEAVKKVKEETCRRIAKGSRNLLVEKKRREE